MKLGTIQVGEEKWTVVVANKDRGFQSDELDGVVTWDTKTIYIARRLGRKQRSMVLLHELLHVLLPEAQESQVRRLERVLFPVLWKWGWRPFQKKRVPTLPEES
tara:strand:- start:2954 stop:3265 length:312 start_codon:yes stop_codon:yes gene_type:complete